MEAPAKSRRMRQLAPAIDGADFVVTMFQIGGYDPATVTDFEIQRNTGCGRRSATPSASAASCAPSARFPF